MRYTLGVIAFLAVATGQQFLSVISCPVDSLVDSVPCGEMRAMIWHPVHNTVYFWGESFEVVDCVADSLLGGGMFWGDSPVAVDTIDDKIYASGYDCLEVLDCAGNQWLHSVYTYERPTGMAWHPGRNRLYVSAGMLIVFDCTTDSVVYERPCGGNSGAVCLIPQANRVYLGRQDTVWVMDVTAESVVGHFHVSGQPIWMMLDSVRGHVYCGVHASGADSILVIDPNGGSLLHAFPARGIGDQPLTPVCLSTKLNRLYMGHGAIDVYDCSTGVRIDSVDVVEMDEMVLDTTDQKLYCCANYSYDNVVRVVDCATNALVDSIRLAGMEPFGLVWVPTVNKVYCGASSLMHAVSEQAPSRTGVKQVHPTIVRSLPAGAVAFDAMGRRVLNPRSGIYFVREEPQASSHKPQAVRKVVIQR